jgi:glycosyltransferase involved in cell wall biosynthesis
VSLTILSVAFGLARVAADTAGGAEQILNLLDQTIARSGHRSLVVAREDSVVAGTLIPVPPTEGSYEDRRTWSQAHHFHRAAIARALCEWPVDLIHMHGLDFHAYLPPHCKVPVLVTLHLPPAWYSREAFAPRPDPIFFNCVSASQRRDLPADLDPLATVANGVPLDDLQFSPRKRRFAIALGRMCPEKGFHHAIDAARMARVPVVLGGAVFPSRRHCSYFNEEIAPRLGRTARYAGPLRGKRKARLLASASCLLVPSLARETSSLVAMEALACGTPVVAFRSGALPEIVEDGRTGFLVDNRREMADAMVAAQSLDPFACRAAAEAKFSAKRMTGQYFELYRRLTNSADAAPEALENAA